MRIRLSQEATNRLCETGGHYTTSAMPAGTVYRWTKDHWVVYAGQCAGGQTGMSESTSWGGGYVYPIPDEAARFLESGREDEAVRLLEAMGR